MANSKKWLQQKRKSIQSDNHIPKRKHHEYLFDWANKSEFVQHCVTCRGPLQGSVPMPCHGKHEEVCPRFHQSWHMIGTAAKCKHCSKEREALKGRLAQIVNGLSQLAITVPSILVLEDMLLLTSSEHPVPLDLSADAIEANLKYTAQHSTKYDIEQILEYETEIDCSNFVESELTRLCKALGLPPDTKKTSKAVSDIQKNLRELLDNSCKSRKSFLRRKAAFLRFATRSLWERHLELWRARELEAEVNIARSLCGARQPILEGDWDTDACIGQSWEEAWSSDRADDGGRDGWVGEDSEHHAGLNQPDNVQLGGDSVEEQSDADVQSDPADDDEGVGGEEKGPQEAQGAEAETATQSATAQRRRQRKRAAQNARRRENPGPPQILEALGVRFVLVNTFELDVADLPEGFALPDATGPALDRDTVARLVDARIREMSSQAVLSH